MARMNKEQFWKSLTISPPNCGNCRHFEGDHPEDEYGICIILAGMSCIHSYGHDPDNCSDLWEPIDDDWR